MSDYLNNIVGRSLSIAEVVQPRLPQLFEHSNQVVDLPPDSSLETHIEQAARPSYEATGSQSVRTKGQLNVADVEPPKSPLATISSAVDASRLTEVLKGAPSIAVDQKATGVDKSFETETVAERARVQKHPPQRPEFAIRSEQQSSAKRVSKPAVKDVASISPAIFQPLETPVVLSSSTGNGHLEQQPTAIKITIGRVDVRAVMPPPAPTRPAPTRPKPALSLESYLKEREQGKR